MAKGLKKRKFSNNQIVVFRFGQRNLVGKVCNIKPVGKRSFVYDVKGEDGIIYEELGVDSIVNHTIDTHKTKLFYKKYGISEEQIPTPDSESSEIDTDSVVENGTESDDVSYESYIDENDALDFSDEDSDPDW